jgi:hypothetical protein
MSRFMSSNRGRSVHHRVDGADHFIGRERADIDPALRGFNF